MNLKTLIPHLFPALVWLVCSLGWFFFSDANYHILLGVIFAVIAVVNVVIAFTKGRG